MHKISKVTINNFKFFYGQVEIPVERKNMLIYGENGSGKSSIYWSLYTFLQSVFKDNAEIRKYFDPKHPENLINRYSADQSNSSIIIELKDDEGVIIPREISLSQINTKRDQLITELTLGSDFINHNTLSRIYAYYHKEEINLFNIFEHELLAFINFKEEIFLTGGTKGSFNADVWWSYINKGGPLNKSKVEYEKQLKIFNKEFERYLNTITQLTNDYISIKFKENFQIRFTYREALYSQVINGVKTRKKVFKSPEIIMSVKMLTDKIADDDKKIIDSPQSFLNEAKLSTIALALRLAILDEKYVTAYPKVLVLDDMLMSMDMSNREFVLNIILENYQSDYQILFFTHQRGLFEDAKKTIQQHFIKKATDAGETNTDNQNIEWTKFWKAMEMYEGENESQIPIPKIQDYGTDLQKAYYYFKEHIDYSACGNNLRNALEEYFREFIPKNSFRDDDGNPVNEKNLMLHSLIQVAKKYFASVNFKIEPLEKIDIYRERSLNKASHYNPKADFYKKELSEIFSLLDLLKKNKRFIAVDINQSVSFEIATESGKVYSYEADLLDEINYYNRNDGTTSYFVLADVIKMNFTSCKIDGVEGKSGYEVKKTLKEIYDDSVSFINKTEKAIVEPDMYKVFKNKDGKTLEQLKVY